MKNNALQNFNYRLKKLQKILQLQKIDCLMLINGEDGCNNFQNAILLNWLFDLNCGLDIPKQNYLKKNFGESIFFVKPNFFECFISNEVYQELKKKLTSIDQKEIETFSKDLEENQRSEFELKKSEYFFKKVQSIQKIAVFLDGQENKKNIIDLEQWPLVQIFSFAQIGEGFFTMQKSISDFKIYTEELYNELDLQYLMFCQSQVQSLQKNIVLVKELLKDESEQNIKNIKQQTLNESLKEVYKIGKLSNQNQNSKFFEPEPYVKLGADQKSINNSLHLTIYDCCPYTNIKYYRTYSLTTNNSYFYYPQEVKNSEGFIVDYVLEKRKDKNFQDEYRISTYYLKMLQFYFKFLNRLRNKQITKKSIENFRQMIQQKISEFDDKMNVNKAPQKQQQILFQIIIYDSFQKEINLDDILQEKNDDFIVSDFLKDKYIFTVKIALNNINKFQSEEVLGDVILGDSFYIYGDYMYNFTSDIQYFDFFSTNTEENLKVANMKDLMAEKFLGQRFQKKCKDIQIYFPLKENILKFQIEMKFEQVQISWFEKGFKVYSKKLGNFIILFETFVENFQSFQDSNQNLLILNLKIPLFFKKFSQNKLIFKFSKNSCTKIFYPFLEQQQKSQNIENLHCIENLFASQTEHFDNLELINYLQIKQKYINNNNFLDSFDYKKYRFVDLNLVEEKHERKFIIFIGHLSNKTKLLSNITTYQKKNQNHDIHNYSYDYFFTQKTDLENYVQSLENYIVNKKGIILLNIPFFIDFKTLISILKQKQLHISSVCSYLNYETLKANNFSGRNIDNYLQEGWINFSIININEKDKDFQNDIKLLEEVYPNTNFMVIKEHRIIFKNLQDIFKENFNKRKNQILRQLSKQNELFKRQVKFIEFAVPIKRVILQKLQFIFNQKDGILIIENKSKIQENLNQIEKEIQLFVQKIKPFQYLKQKKANQIKSLSGFIRFEEDIQNLYYLKIAKNHFSLELIQENLEYEQIEIQNQKFFKVNYPNEISNKIKIMIEYQDFFLEDYIQEFYDILLNQKNEIFKKEQFNKDQIKKILKEFAEFGLENGDRFDGFLWRDQFGKVYSTHPKKNEVLQKYRQQQQQEFNQKIRNKQNQIKNSIKIYKDLIKQSINFIFIIQIGMIFEFFQLILNQFLSFFIFLISFFKHHNRKMTQSQKQNTKNNHKKQIFPQIINPKISRNYSSQSYIKRTIIIFTQQQIKSRKKQPFQNYIRIAFIKYTTFVSKFPLNFSFLIQIIQRGVSQTKIFVYCIITFKTKNHIRIIIFQIFIIFTFFYINTQSYFQFLIQVFFQGKQVIRGRADAKCNCIFLLISNAKITLKLIIIFRNIDFFHQIRTIYFTIISKMFISFIITECYVKIFFVQKIFIINSCENIRLGSKTNNIRKVIILNQSQISLRNRRNLVFIYFSGRQIVYAYKSSSILILITFSLIRSNFEFFISKTIIFFQTFE